MRWASLGGGGHASQVRDAMLRAGHGPPVGFFDTTGELEAGRESRGMRCLGGWDALRALLSSEPLALVLGFGHNAERLRMAVRLREIGATLHRAVDPSAVVAEDALLGEGAVVLARAVVGPGSRIGLAAAVNAGAVLPHDAVVGDGAHVAPGAVFGGHVSVGARTLVGLGAVVRDRVTIGADVTIGAGAVVVADVPDGSTVVGVPARPLVR